MEPMGGRYGVNVKFGTTVVACLVWSVSGFRGPHHPRSDISHHHYAPQKDVKLTQDSNLLHDTSHLEEDLGRLGDQVDLSEMTDQEMEFYYFKLHDMDNNTKLDGLEILHAIQHTLHDSEEHATDDKIQDLNSLPWIVDIIDRVMEEDDLDNDGYLGYTEFVLGRQKDEKQLDSKNKLRIGTK